MLVYTLWKRFDLLPALSTPSAVIPVLTGGADLMIPGGVSYTCRPHYLMRFTIPLSESRPAHLLHPGPCASELTRQYCEVCARRGRASARCG